MNKEYRRIEKCLAVVRSKTDFVPKVALVLGSGLGSFADEIDVKFTIEYKEIENFPISTVNGHKGRFVFGYVGNVPVVIMQGRVHYYEGYPMNDVVLPIRLMKLMGAKVLFLTNAAGSVNPDYSAGDFMLIKDQISSFVPSPLIGENIDELGDRFPDMSEIYSKQLQNEIREAAKKTGVTLQEGVYVQLTGPNFESPVEVKMCQILGGDAVGMSTACEAIAGNHCKMQVCGISCISNVGSGLSSQILSHSDVSNTANRVAPIFKNLVKNSIINIGEKI